MILAKYIAVVLLMLFLKSYSTYLNRPRNSPYYLQHELEHLSDSLLNNWKEEMIKRDTL